VYLEPAQAVVPSPSTLSIAAIGAIPAERVDRSGAASDRDLIPLWLHGRPARTAEAYATDAASLLDHLHAQGQTLATLTLAALQAWVGSLSGAASSRARRVSAAKSLLSFAHRTGYVPFNVGAALRAPVVRRTLPRALTQGQVERLLEAAPVGRARALCTALYLTGARVSELLAVTWADVTPQGEGAATIAIVGKGNRPRRIRVRSGVLPESGEPSEPVFKTRTGRALSVREAQAIVRRAAVAAGLTEAVSPHWLRHAHVSHALDAGAPVHTVQATVGHASLATTSRYAHPKPGACSSDWL
jgi:integrase/recombinase XerD